MNKILSFFKKPEVFILFLSLVGTGIISSLLALAGSSIVGAFWSWFILTFVLQVVGFLVVNSVLIQKQNNFLRQSEIQALEEYSKFTIRLLCAYCNQTNDVQIQLNQKNMFKCISCNQTNGVHMQFTSTTITTPIESVKLPLPDSEPAEIKV